MRLLSLWSLATLLPVAFAGKPEVHKEKFDYLPAALFYFEDSPVILAFDSQGSNVYRSDNDGKNWNKISDVEGKAFDIMEHPYNDDRAIIFGEGKTHWVTKDKGKSWKKFDVPLPISFRQSPIAFSAADPNYALYASRECDPGDIYGFSCRDKTYYTKDWFDSEVKPLKEDTHSCLFARGNPLFKEAKVSTVLCIVDGDDKYPEHRKLMMSDNFFEDSIEPKLDGYNHVRGLAGLASVKKFLVAAIRSAGTDEMALYVSDNATTWDRAEFPQDHGGLKEDAYTILESTPYSIQVDVLTTSGMGPAMGELFSSNSNGTYFTRDLDHTNRIHKGLVDFEQIQGIEGIMLANIIKNADEIKQSRHAKKQLQSKISFDDGKMGTWKALKTTDDKELHLHSVTELINGGRVFSSAAPGIVAGVGNTGDYLKAYEDGDLYISDDAGLKWKKSRESAHKYEFGGAGSIIVAVFDEGYTNKISYSKDHGENWNDLDLEVEIRARLLTTTPDSTTLKFLLVGTTKDKKTLMINLDFSGVFDRECKLDKDDDSKSDYEKWYARLDDDKKPDCLMGRKQFYWRRKKDKDCNASKDFKEPEVETEVCECQAQDFECDFNFIRDSDGKCVLAPGVKLPIPPNECKNPKDEYKGPSGYRKIPGNSCKGGETKDEPITRKCEDAISAPSTGKIVATPHGFYAKRPVSYYYPDNAESGEVKNQDETIFMLTDRQEVWMSHDGGKKWSHVLKDIKVLALYPNPYVFDHVYFITSSKDIHYTRDRGRSFSKMEALAAPNRKGMPFLEFHPREPGWLIWHGEKDCASSTNCHTTAYYTTSGGEEWHVLKPYSGSCRWVRGKAKDTPKQLAFCEHEPKEGDPGQKFFELVSSSDFFVNEEKHFDRIVGFATMQEFLVVAGVKDDQSLQASASIDGHTFADAHFPHGFNVPHQTAYTVLDSVTHSVFLHVTVNDLPGLEYGSLLKSNSNGTNYVLSLDAVNRNEDGYVDFEKMQSLEGIAVANRVINWEAAAKGERKKLRSMITHNDGSWWKYIKPPSKDSEGKPYKCSGDLEQCSLNLHHYTERTDPRHTFSSGSAIGLMMGVGNVGDHLTGYKDGDTFLTTDGGLTWTEVRKGPHLWEYGDQGSIIIIVDRVNPTDTVHYTLDEGKSWQDFKFGEKMRVVDITTVSMDNSRRFLLWGLRDNSGEKFYTVNLDFTGITDQECKLDESKGEEDSPDDDFYLWKPQGDGHCLFGHEALYHRKIPEHRCFIGKKLERLHGEPKNCECVAEDFECDFNYERQSDNTCKLIEGYAPPNHEEVCKSPGVFEYFKPTGYRRIPSSTCAGGRELDKSESLPCPGQENREKWKKKHSGLSGFGLFMVIVLSFAAAGAVGYYVWTRIFNGQFGAIRLGEDNGGNFVQYPIIVISAIIAVAMAIPSILSAIGSWVGSKFTRTRRYTTRSSFARGDYSIVNNDEGELLGSDDDDEV
ncbi:hypothetical protein FN846DRAFT_910817 [Sphaerosporella brunnea]|uniref:Vacuolar protein sorting/targeting protein 10 n=1 Tax=Sphaerosporella brunnea TaxID=1250544 RepID=A0A5J5EMA1_9PEZI|nr:hypothetical protein FN846DRAFT_910817 [Sphaerosporella brunnea]